MAGRKWLSTATERAAVIGAIALLVAAMIGIRSCESASPNSRSAGESLLPGDTGAGRDATVPDRIPVDSREAAAEAPPRRTSVSLKETLETLASPELTRIQKEEFCNANAGRLALWEGHVRQVTRLMAVKEPAAVMMMVTPAHQADEKMPDLLVIVFKAGQDADLVKLAIGTWVQVEGTLEFDAVGMGQTVSLRNAVLLKHEVRAK